MFFHVCNDNIPSLHYSQIHLECMSHEFVVFCDEFNNNKLDLLLLLLLIIIITNLIWALSLYHTLQTQTQFQTQNQQTQYKLTNHTNSKVSFTSFL